MQTVSIAHGDGIGPEIMQATLAILKAARADLVFEDILMGEQVYLAGHPSGIDDSAFRSLRKTRVLLKAPMTTPQGEGRRSLNVTLRTSFGLYANIRPCIAYAPFIPTQHPGMNLVVIRENEEDLYTGIEYRQSPDTCHALKLISRPGCEKIIRYAFEYARRYHRKKITCLTKDNILKITDGLFHRTFQTIGHEYPDIEQEHLIVDIGMAKIAHTPQHFDVIVLPNLYGDILSDITAQISGSVGLVGTANLGEYGAMFEAIHGSAPKLAGKDQANPSGLILAAVLMLIHLGQGEVAETIHNAWLKTLEDGYHTHDIYHPKLSYVCVGTQAFAQAVIARLGDAPSKLMPAHYLGNSVTWTHHGASLSHPQRQLMGVDVYLYSHAALDHLISRLQHLCLGLTAVTNRGTRVWPQGHPETSCSDQWRCRFETAAPIPQTTIIKLLEELDARGMDVIRTEHLYHFNGKPGYSGIEGL